MESTKHATRLDKIEKAVVDHDEILFKACKIVKNITSTALWRHLESRHNMVLAFYFLLWIYMSK